MPIDPLYPPPLTPDLFGVGGRIKVEPDDFLVEEVPSYEPVGTGEHLYLWVQKRDVAPEFFARTIAQRLDIPVGTIGTAGLKDRRAITRQWVSVPQEAEPRLNRVDGAGITLLSHSRHTNKLKPGHLKGNRFDILIRDADFSRADACCAVLERIQAQGLPNYYGLQRFGHDGGNIDLGFRCLAGTQPKRLRPFVYRFALSAVQSLMFNDYLGRRMIDGHFRTVLPGDVMGKWPAGGLFVAEDLPTEQQRFNSRETVMCGPMFGKHTFAAAGLAAQREAAVLADHNLNPTSFDGFGKLMGGTRRHNLVYLDDLSAVWEQSGLRLKFTLPSGCYATVLLREVMKAPLNIEPDGDDD
jgi:tRNA pseudouridine13 synthase